MNASEIRLPRAVADTEKGIILASADVNAPPERVFRALTTRDEVEQWWGAPAVYTVRDWIAEVRTGGKYTMMVQRPDGSGLPASGEFLVVDPPRKLSHTRKYDWDYPELGRRVTTVTFLLEPVEGGTRITMRHEGFEGLSKPAYDHAGGWERFLGWLRDYLES